MAQALRELDPRSSPLAAFGAELRERRLAARYSLRELGRLVLVSGDLLGKIEKAQRRPQADLVRRMDETLRAEGVLIRLAGSIADQDCELDPMGQIALPPDTAADQLRRLVVEVRGADHSMNADRLHEVLSYSKAAESIVAKVSVSQRGPLFRGLGEAQQLAGWMMFDRGRSRSAERMFASARASAEHAKALDLVAFVGGPNFAFMSMWGGDPALGAEQAYGAMAWAYRSGNRRLTAFVATMAARAHARMGEAELCMRMLGTAETELTAHLAEGADPDWLSVFDLSALSGHRGSCLLDLGRPREAMEALEKQSWAAQRGYVRNNIIWKLECADANLRLGEVEAAVAMIEQSLDQARVGVSPRVVRVFRSLNAAMGACPRKDPGLFAVRERLRAFIWACG